MNRIVLIGNGFDLAHGLKTSYQDFINWYWEQWMNKLLNRDKSLIDDGLCKIEILKNIPEDCSLEGYDFVLILNEQSIIKFTPYILLEKIMRVYNHSNWVDIEVVYYKLLCESMKEDSRITHKELNKQLNVLTQKLYEYLTLNDNEYKIDLNDSIRKKIYEPIKKSDIAVESKQIFIDLIEERKEFDKTCNVISSYVNELSMFKSIRDYDVKDYITDLQETDERIWNYRNNNNPALLPSSIMLVNFNYTDIADAYLSKNGTHFRTNHIHGNLNRFNSMIFGYGDELDECYKEISNKNDNEYLRNVKSIKYLEASNYRQLLQFIDSEPYQIYVMGHSCGNSDRTLLNTLFEHKNCVSVKPFYYKKEDGTDNYTDIVQNISRNFKDKKALRDRVVNKELCEPLIDKTKKETLSSLDYYIDLLSNMKRSTIHETKTPYKPILMVAIIELIAHQNWKKDKVSDVIPFSSNIEIWYENIWKKHSWQSVIFNKHVSDGLLNVLHYMEDEPFYKLVPFPSKIYKSTNDMSGVKEAYFGIKLDDELMELLIDTESREKLKEVLEEMIEPNKHNS